MHGGASKQYIIRFYGTPTFNDVRFDENPFTSQGKKGKKKRGSNFALLFVIFKRHRGSEAVKCALGGESDVH